MPLGAELMHVDSNKISDVLAQCSTTALAGTQDLLLTSVPGDDLAEEDFADRVQSLLQPMAGLVSLTICIPSMARLHPSNSLPKVLDILRDASTLLPQCRLGLIVRDAEQAWSALTILKRIVEMRLQLDSIEFSLAFCPVEALIQAAQVCNLASLTLHSTQVSSSSPSGKVARTAGDNSETFPSIPTLTSLTAQVHSEVSPGLDILLQTAASTVTHLHLSPSSSGSNVTIQGYEFPHLTRLNLHETLLPEILHTRMPRLQELIVPALTRTESCDMIQESLQSSWPLLWLRDVQVTRAVAGDASDALVRLEESHKSLRVTIGELAVGDPERVTPAALAISENLVNAGPPIGKDWPLGFEDRQYPRLKSIVLKVHEGGNYDAFIASLDAPNLDAPPNISVIKKKSKNTKKR